MLTEHGLAIAMPPRFEVLDEVGEAIYLEDRWRSLATRLFDPTGPLSDVVARAVELGMTPKHLREIVTGLHHSYDRLAGSVHDRMGVAASKRHRSVSVDLSSYVLTLQHLPLDGRSVLADHLRRAEDAPDDLDASTSSGPM